MAVKKPAKTVAKAAAAARTASAPVKARKAKAKAAPKPAITLPDGYKQMNRTSLTALYRRLSGDEKAGKFGTRSEGRQALEALVV
jgi:hypothetical protein